jgi:hypothetical protein
VNLSNQLSTAHNHYDTLHTIIYDDPRSLPSIAFVSPYLELIADLMVICLLYTRALKPGRTVLTLKFVYSEHLSGKQNDFMSITNYTRTIALQKTRYY